MICLQTRLHLWRRLGKTFDQRSGQFRKLAPVFDKNIIIYLMTITHRVWLPNLPESEARDTIQFNSIQFKSLFIRSKDKNTYLMLQVNIKNTLVKFTSYE